MENENTGIQPWHVLLVDDDEEDYFLTKAMLKEAKGRKVNLDWTSTYEQGVQSLCGSHYDVALIDYDLGGKTGIDLIREMDLRGCLIPLVLFTGRGSYEVDVEALEAGATMYLTKSEANPLLLERIIRYAIERKQAEEKLAASEENYHRLFSTMLNGFALHEIILDEAGKPSDYRFLDVNPAFEHLTGLKAEDVVGRTVKEVLPDIESVWIDTYGHVALTGESIEFKNYSASLKKYYQVYAFSPRKNQFAALFTDITGHLNALQATMESEQRYQALAAATFEGILISQNGIILDANEQMLEICGYRADELIGQEITMLVVPEDRQKVIENTLAGREGVFEYDGLRKDGTHVPVEARAKMISYKDRQVRVTTVRDVTEQRQMMEALRESEERYSNLFNNYHTPMLLIDPDTAEIVDANPAACEFYGWSKDDLTQMKITDINTQAAEETFQKIGQALSVPSNKQFTFYHRLANGKRERVDVHSGPIQIRNKTYLFSIIHDLSTHKI